MTTNLLFLEFSVVMRKAPQIALDVSECQMEYIFLSQVYRGSYLNIAYGYGCVGR